MHEGRYQGRTVLRKTLETVRLQDKEEWLDGSVWYRAVQEGLEKKAGVALCRSLKSGSEILGETTSHQRVLIKDMIGFLF